MQIKLAFLMNADLIFPIFIGIFLTIGIGFFFTAVGAFRLLKRRREINLSLKTVGRVVEIIEIRGGPRVGGKLYAPKVAFQTNLNQIATFTSETATRPCLYNIGDTVELYYNPQNPQQAELLDNSIETWFYAAFIIIGIGLMFFGFFGVIMLIFMAMR